MTPRAYISYSRDEGPAFDTRLLQLASRLRDEGVDARLDKYEEAPASGRARWIHEQIRTADFVIIACSPSYYARFNDASLPGRTEQWEAALVYSLVYTHPEFRARAIPVLLEGQELTCVPELFRDGVSYRLPEDYPDLYRRLTDQPALTPMPMGSTRQEITNLTSIPRSACFVGRDAELRSMHEALSLAPDMAGPACVAVSALGGTGKSRLALEYAHEPAKDYVVRWWLRAATTQGLEEDFDALSRALGLAGPNDDPDASRRRALDWLGAHEGWLLIFDNATDVAAIRPFIPGMGRGAVLVTSRAQGWRAIGTSLELDQLPPSEALELVVRRSGRQDDGKGEELCRELGHLALALTQAAAYIEATRSSFAEYLDMFREVGLEVFGSARAATGDHYRSAVHKTWKLSIEKVAEKQPDSVALLRFLAFLDPDGVSMRVLTEHADVLPAALRDSISSTWRRNRLLEELLAYSLIERKDELVRVHRLVQAVVRASLDNDRTLEVAGGVIDWVDTVFAYSPAHTPVRDVPGGIAKQLVVACSSNAGVAARPERSPELLGNAGVFYQRLGYVAAARTICQAGVDAARHWTSAIPEASAFKANLCAALDKLGEVELKAGHLQQARDHRLEAMTLAQDVARDDASPQSSRSLAICMMKFAELESMSGRSEHAANLDRCALSIMDGIPEVQRQDVGSRRIYCMMLTKVAEADAASGGPAAAEAGFSRSVEILGEIAREVPESEQVRADVSSALGSQGRFELSRGHTEVARGVFTRALGLDEELAELDPGDTMRLHNLFVALSRLGQLELGVGNIEAAGELFERAWRVASGLAAADPNDSLAQFRLVQAHVAYMQWAGAWRDPEVFNENLDAARAILATMEERGQVRGFEGRQFYRDDLERLARHLRDAGGWPA